MASPMSSMLLQSNTPHRTLNFRCIFQSNKNLRAQPSWSNSPFLKLGRPVQCPIFARGVSHCPGSPRQRSHHDWNVGTTNGVLRHPSLKYRYISSKSSSGGSGEGDKGAKRSLPKIEEDGLTLSHFIAKSASSTNDKSHNFDQNSNNDGSSNSFYYSSTPMPADLGDEFDDETKSNNVDENEAFLEEDLMVTDAMSSSTNGNFEDDHNKNKSLPSNSLDRLRQQMMMDSEIDETADNDDLHTLKFHIKTYGCQMNVNDTDIVRSILLNHNNMQHFQEPSLDNTAAPSTPAAAKSDESTSSFMTSLQFKETTDEIEADILLTNTCAIRDNAEQKVWHRLRALRAHDRNFPLEKGLRSNHQRSTRERRKNNQKKADHQKKKRIIGVLGCMAERLKEDMFQDGTADLVVGPDAYRDLPRLISVLTAPSVVPASADKTHHSTHSNKKVTPTIPTERAVNVQLSLDETYASVTPIRANPHDVSAFVSIMRGCNNMCSYCVVPFTRGRERSREMESVVEETRRLLDEEGIKEVILLGQNVNSYHDVSGEKRRQKELKMMEKQRELTGANSDSKNFDSPQSDSNGNDDNNAYQTSNPGFQSLFRLRKPLNGHRFVDLLDAVSSLSPELRVRFTSPHPKDYPPPLLSLMAERPNICNHLHMPAQSGSSAVLQRMRRGYTREAYLELIDDVKRLIPDVAISSDFISGFCGETEEEHLETLSLMEKVQFDQAFMFAYSMRERTHAHRTMEDDVPAEVKNKRLNEVISTFRGEVQKRNDEVEVGKMRLVLVEGESKRSTKESRMWSGRTDQNKRVVFPDEGVGGNGSFWTEEEVRPFLSNFMSSGYPEGQLDKGSSFFERFANDYGQSLRTEVSLARGDYVVVEITEARAHTLRGRALWRSSIVGFEKFMSTNGMEDFSLARGNALKSSLSNRLII